MSNLYKNLNHTILINKTQVMIQTTGITPVKGTAPIQVSGTELFSYFDEFLVIICTKFGYTSFMKVVPPYV